MIPRYATPLMTAIWSDEARWSAALQVELAVLDAQADNFHKLAGILDKRLAQHQWISGTPSPTIADVALAAPMHLHGWQQLPLAAHPHLSRWLKDGVEQLTCWSETTVYEGFTTQAPVNA